MNTHDISNNQDDNFLLLRNQRVEGNRKAEVQQRS